jgi:hypothetical protein
MSFIIAFILAGIAFALGKAIFALIAFGWLFVIAFVWSGLQRLFGGR